MRISSKVSLKFSLVNESIVDIHTLSWSNCLPTLIFMQDSQLVRENISLHTVYKKHRNTPTNEGLVVTSKTRLEK